MEHSKIQLRKRTDYFDVVIYYSNYNCSVDEKRELIINTGIKVPKKYVTEKTKEISKKFPDYDKHYATITNAKERVEFIVNAYYKTYRQKPLCSYVEEEYKKPVVLEQQKLECIVDYYTDFLNFKATEIKEGSMGFYRNNVSAFEEYEKHKRKGAKITFADFENRSFWESFILFLANEKEDKTRVNQKRFGLSNNTLIKRLKTIREFIRFAVKKHKINLNHDDIKEDIASVRKKNEINSYAATKFSLTLDELQELVWFKPTCYEREKDILVFMSLQGMRISDTMTFTKKDIVKFQGVEYVNKEAKKTVDFFTNEYHPVAKEIFEKWGCDFSDMVKFNEHIKIVMKEFFLWYKFKFESETGKEYDVMLTKYKKNGKIAEKIDVYKWDIISSHYGRGSYISLLAAGNKVSLKEIGSRTGQKSVSTTLGYVRPVNTVTAEELLPITNKKKVVKKPVKTTKRKSA